MNGIGLLLLLLTSAQVEVGTERDYGWAVSKEDGALEYIVQINPDKKLAMEQKSVLYPNGQENVSNMPRELIGRASRVVVRFGTEVLPREPSLQELENTPRLFEKINPSATAMLGPGRMQDVEPFDANLRDIQGQGAAPVYPALPTDPTVPQGPQGSAVDLPDQVRDPLRRDLTEDLSSALPDVSALAQNLTNQGGAANAFLNEANGKFNDTAPRPNSPSSSVAIPSSSTKFPEFPITGSASGAGTNAAATNNRGQGSSPGSGVGTTYPSLNQSPPTQTLPTQTRQPPPSFGAAPSIATRGSTDTIGPFGPTSPSYSTGQSQPRDNSALAGSPNYLPSTPNDGWDQNPALLARRNTPSYDSAIQAPGTSTGRPATIGGSGLTQVEAENLEKFDSLMESLDKNKDGRLTADEYASPKVDGVVLTLFVVSLLVNLFLAHLIRKLLMRYRLVLTNVRSQAAYT